jgi:lysophospholipase L1-like esterase
LELLEGRCHGYQYQTTADPTSRKNAIIDYRALWATVDPVRFYRKDQPNSTFKSFIQDPANNVASPFNGWHPSPDAHEAWAQELARYIKAHKLL